MPKEMFVNLVGKDNGGLFWTHLEHLRNSQRALVPPEKVVKTTAIRAIPSGKRTSAASKNLELFTKESSGTIQLWQFLLELLASGNHRDCLEWAGEEGEFRLINPERVAELWGHRKNKANMNYEKMSRALRYYYDGDILGKVPGKHFTYKFICDLKSMVGYSYDELVGTGGNESPVYSFSASTPTSPRGSATESDGGSDGLVSRIPVPKPKLRQSATSRRSRANGLQQVHA
jgi:GA-binding protein transcription factor alpha